MTRLAVMVVHCHCYQHAHRIHLLISMVVVRCLILTIGFVDMRSYVDGHDVDRSQWRQFLWMSLRPFEKSIINTLYSFICRTFLIMHLEHWDPVTMWNLTGQPTTTNHVISQPRPILCYGVQFLYPATARNSTAFPSLFDLCTSLSLI